MVSTLIAALAAIVAALLSIAAPESAPEQAPAPPAAIEEIDNGVEDLRAAIQAFVQETIAASASGVLQIPPDVSANATLSRSGPARTEPAPEEDRCETDEASGDGWQRLLVRCLQRSVDGGSSSISVSSSSHVTVQETSSDDTP
jgi:hypothetical protein